jgi:hypothetical protein
MGYPTTSIEKQQQANAVISKGYEDRMNYQSFRLVRPRTFTYSTPDESEGRPEEKTIHKVDNTIIYFLGAMSILVIAGMVLR